MGLNDVLEATSGEHVHGVNVGLAKERSGKRDNGQNVDLGDLPKLALVTGVDIPLDVMIESGPPEVVKNSALSRIDALVS